MTLVFWILAGLLLLAGLVILLRPLLRPRKAGAAEQVSNQLLHRDQLREAERDLAADLITPERFEQARQEIQRRLLEDADAADAAAAPAPWRPARRSAIVLALLIPLASVLTYLQVGQPLALQAQSEDAADGDAEPGATPNTASIEQAVAALAEKLQREPDNAAGWVMLGRSYGVLGRHDDAAQALRRAQALTPRDPDVLADLADAVAMAQGRRLAGEPTTLVRQALEIDPRHVKSLALAGSAAIEAKDMVAARGYWQRLIAVLPPDSPLLPAARDALAVAGGAADRAAPAAAATAAGLRGRVEIQPALAAKIGATDTLYIFARGAAPDSPRLPLAILRRGAQELPAEFTLDDSMAMSPASRLSGTAQVVVGARISRSGNATPQPGDLIGQSQPVANNASGVRVLIDAVQP